MNLLSCTQTTKFLAYSVTLKLLSHTCIQFCGVKFLGIQHMIMKCSYYSLFLLFLGIHIKASQKYLISQCNMKGQNKPLLDTDTSTDLQLVALDNFRLSTRLCKKICFFKRFNFQKERFFMPEKSFFYCVHT